MQYRREKMEKMKKYAHDIKDKVVIKPDPKKMAEIEERIRLIQHNVAWLAKPEDYALVKKANKLKR